MKPKIQVVFDTNIYLSAILFGGNPRMCLELGRSGEIELFVSRAILLEVAQKLQQKFLWSEEEIKEVTLGLIMFAQVISPRVKVTIIKAEPKDNKIKKHLLSLQNFKNIALVSAKQFLEIYYS